MTKLRYIFPLFIVLLLPVTMYSQSASDVNVSGSLAPDKIKKGRVVRASVGPDNVASLATIAHFGFVQIGQQWDDEDGLELVFERPVTPAGVSPPAR